VHDESIVLLDAAAGASLVQQMETHIRRLHANPAALAHIGRAGQTLTRQLYAPERQIGQRQHILRNVAVQLGLPVSPPHATAVGADAKAIVA
jgi:lipopolysaccharide transport system ATP-binding protein